MISKEPRHARALLRQVSVRLRLRPDRAARRRGRAAPPPRPEVPSPVPHVGPDHPSHRARAIVAAAAALAVAGAAVGVWVVSRPGDRTSVSTAAQPPASAPVTAAPPRRRRRPPWRTPGADHAGARPRWPRPPSPRRRVSLPASPRSASHAPTRRRFTISYPSGWHAEQVLPHWLCSRFDPNTLEQVPPDSELPRPRSWSSPRRPRSRTRRAS